MMLNIAVFRTSLKENEKRAPIFPGHIPFIDPDIRATLFFEDHYGVDFGVSDSHIKQLNCQMMSRDDLFLECDVLLIPKPTVQDFSKMKPHQIHWGWPHCVQHRDVTQIAIDRHLTFIAWESMNQRFVDHSRENSVSYRNNMFYRNNELAGYCSVIHALGLLGLDGRYGQQRTIAVIGLGAVGRGFLHALHGRGFNNIHVYTQRITQHIKDRDPRINYNQYIIVNGTPFIREIDGSTRPLFDDLAQADIICNGILQNPNAPVMFVSKSQIKDLKDGVIVLDVSCDRGMGFEFAEPTSFRTPFIMIDAQKYYYSVDNVPSYLWNAASRELSLALLPFLKTVTGGPDSWKQCHTISNAIEILDGNIINKSILQFQKRGGVYPHAIESSQ